MEDKKIISRNSLHKATLKKAHLAWEGSDWLSTVIFSPHCPTQSRIQRSTHITTLTHTHTHAWTHAGTCTRSDMFAHLLICVHSHTRHNQSHICLYLHSYVFRGAHTHTLTHNHTQAYLDRKQKEWMTIAEAGRTDRNQGQSPSGDALALYFPHLKCPSWPCSYTSKSYPSVGAPSVKSYL